MTFDQTSIQLRSEIVSLGATVTPLWKISWVMSSHGRVREARAACLDRALGSLQSRQPWNSMKLIACHDVDQPRSASVMSRKFWGSGVHESVSVFAADRVDSVVEIGPNAVRFGGVAQVDAEHLHDVAAVLWNTRGCVVLCGAETSSADLADDVVVPWLRSKESRLPTDSVLWLVARQCVWVTVDGAFDDVDVEVECVGSATLIQKLWSELAGPS